MTPCCARIRGEVAETSASRQLWDIYREGNLLRSFMGHTKAVKDVTFTNDGRKFLSCGYDRQMKLWDTETGQCIKAFSNGKTPYVLRFHPDDDKQHIFLAGMSDKKIIQVRALRLAAGSARDRSRTATARALLLAERHTLTCLSLLRRTVRHKHRRDYPRIRPAPRPREHNHVRRR